MAEDTGATDAGDTTAVTDSDGDDPGCFAAGGELSTLSEDPWTFLEPGIAEAGRAGLVRLLATPAGGWGLFNWSPDDGEVVAYGITLDLDGNATSPAVPVEDWWSNARPWQGPELALLTACTDSGPRWGFVDLVGMPASAPMTPEAPAACSEPLSVAWLGPEDALVTWVDEQRTCEDESGCVMLAHVKPSGTVLERGLLWAGVDGRGPRASVAAGLDGGLVTFVRWRDQFNTDVDLVAARVDATGALVDAPVLVPLPQAEEFEFRNARAVADDDGFLVFLGGYGDSIGRLRIGSDGTIVEPLDALPAVETSIAGYGAISSVLATDFDGLEPRPWGLLAFGEANTEEGGVQKMLLALDHDGHALGEPILFGAESYSIATDGTRQLLFLSQAGMMRVVEFGCVVQ